MATQRARDNDLIGFFFLLHHKLLANSINAPRLDIIKTAGALKSSNRAIDYAEDTLESIRAALAIHRRAHSSGSIKTVSLGVMTLGAEFSFRELF